MNRVRSQLCLWVIFWSFVASCSAWSAEQPVASPPEMMLDAELTSVTFVDAEVGWAVGDRGVIWHTADGGRHWQRQDSPTTCRLEQVFFLNHQEGWAVGGWPHAYSSRSSGVVLHTSDGGGSWHTLPGLTLPALKYVKFFTTERGVAVGESSALYASGVFTTRDGGKSWQALPSLLPQAWQAADFAHEQQGILLSANGQIQLTNLLELTSARTPLLTTQLPRDVQSSAVGDVWLCGDGGLISRSTNQGVNWQPATAACELLVSKQMDFASIATYGTHVWLAGNPGCIVLHSSDRGATWETFHTEHTLPIRDLHFADENRGWAVGAFGTILATRDGGRTWRVQQQGGARAALLCLVGTPQALPGELLVQLAGNEAYLSAVEIMTTRRSLLVPQTEQLARARAACSAWGVAATELNAACALDDLCEYSDQETILAAIRSSASQSANPWEERMVRRIRQWRPDVILTEEASPRGERPLGHLINQATIAAVQKAEDPREYPEHGKLWGLNPWKIKKVFTSRRDSTTGIVSLTTSQLAPRLGCSLLDGADLGRGLCDFTTSFTPQQQGFDLLIDQLPQGQGRRDIFSGIVLKPNSEARRAFSTPTTTDLPKMAKRVQQRQSLQKIFERLEHDPARGVSWLAQVTELTREAHPENATRALYHLAHRYEASGEWEFASQVWQYLLDRYPEHPLANVAATWLVRFHGSAEYAWRKEANLAASAGLALSPAENDKAIQPVSATQPLPTSLIAKDRTLQALSIARQQEVKHPVWFADPTTRYAIAHATQARGEVDQAEKLFRGLAATGEVETAWSLSAAAENWLNTREGACPKPYIRVLPAPQKPRLNGKLEEACWQQAAVLSIGQDAQAAITFDDEFLFLALSCKKVPNVTYATDNKTRQRDEDLSRQDRVEICFDVDRDYASYLQLIIDHRGRSRETCGGDLAWNPAWFIATGGDEQYWTAEAAIAWNEGLPRTFTENRVWACGVQRRIPNHALRSWSKPAHPEILPEGFGLLEFVQK